MPNQDINLSEIGDLDYDELNLKSSVFWKYHQDNAIATQKTKSIFDLDLIIKQYDLFFEKLWLKNDFTFNKKNNFTIRVMLEDIDTKVEIDLFTRKFSILDSISEVDFSVTTETLYFLFKNNFGRGTVVVNSRIKFNYLVAHRFFIFFSIPYQNNIGTYFNKERPFKKSDLINIQDTSVMRSIFKISPEYREQFILDCENFFNSSETSA